MYKGSEIPLEARVVNIDRVLAKLKEQRRGTDKSSMRRDIDKAIAALESLRSIRRGSGKKRTTYAQRPRPTSALRIGKVKDLTRVQERHGDTGIALVLPTRQVG